MSLDVYLTMDAEDGVGGSGIYVREDGATNEISREEWDSRYPGREPCIVPKNESVGEVYWRNITHNLNTMADEAGIYKHLWRPDEIGVTKAAQLVQPLKDGLATLQADPDKFKTHNPPNGWGCYEGLCEFVAEYLAACIRFPSATVSVSR